MKLYIAVLFVLVFSACGSKTEKPVLQYMPHMASTPNIKPQKGYEGLGNGSGMLMPPEGTIPRGFKPYNISDVNEAEKVLVNPLPQTKKVLERGQVMYQTYCWVCHGDKGLGDGPVITPPNSFPMPKSLQSETMLKWKDGHLFHVITKGQGIMPSYAQQVLPADRWAIIHYIRALQRAEHPSAADLAAYQKSKVK